MCTIIFQCDSTSPFADWQPAGLATIDEALSCKKDLILLPNNFSLQSHQNWQAMFPASAQKARNVAQISLLCRDLRPKHQLYCVAQSPKINAYLNTPMERQSPNAILRCTTSRNLAGVWSIGFPREALGIVAYVPIETGNSPVLMKVPSFDAATRCDSFWNNNSQ